MSDIEIEQSGSEEQVMTANEARRRSRLGLGKPKKLQMIEEPELSEEEGWDALEKEQDAEEQANLESIKALNDEEEEEPHSKKDKSSKKVKIDVPQEEDEEPKPVKSKKEKKAEFLKKKAAKMLFGVVDEEEPETEDQSKITKLDLEDEVIDEDEVSKPKKSSKPKGKYDDMTLKQLQGLTKERNVAGRSSLKNRESIIAKLEELDASPQVDEEPKPKNKYQSMTIPELKKLMGERNIAGRSTVKTKDAMIEKLVNFDETPDEELAPKFNGKGLGKDGAQRHKKEKVEEDPMDEEVNKKVAELVNKIYKMKKHAKKQSVEFKNGFMEYIQDLSKLVEDYQESCN